ncbi:MAG TPA: hypothetical protein ENN39_05735 [Desulfonatronum sp.]|nr:hypothetical protein [Desulfonatronum sp.]
MIDLARSIWTHRFAMYSQFVVNIKTTVAATKLGPLWWILDPLVLMAVYTFVIKIVFNRGGPGFHLFALCGIVTWQSFSKALNNSARSLQSNQSLIRQTALPMQLYVLIPPIVQSFFYLIGLTIIAIWNHDVVGWQTLAAPALLLPMVLLPFGLGLFLSIIIVHIPDLGKFLPYFLRMGFFFSPVLYAPERIYNMQGAPEILKTLFAMNPMVHVITAVRDLLFTGKMFNMATYLIIIGVSLALVQFGLLFSRRYAPGIPKAL